MIMEGDTATATITLKEEPTADVKLTFFTRPSQTAAKVPIGLSATSATIATDATDFSLLAKQRSNT